VPGVGRETHATAGQEAGATDSLSRLTRNAGSAFPASSVDEACNLSGCVRGHLAEAHVNELMAPLTVPALFCATNLK